MILVAEILICCVIFMQTVVVPIVVLFRQPSGQIPQSGFFGRLYSNKKPSPQNKIFSWFPQIALSALCFMLFFTQGTYGFLWIGILFVLVAVSRLVLHEYKSLFGDERDFDLMLRTRSASLFVAVGSLMLYFIAFPNAVDAFTLIAGFRLVQYFLEIVFVYLVNAAQNRTLETEEA
jgi:hypothetical protein